MQFPLVNLQIAILDHLAWTGDAVPREPTDRHFKMPRPPKGPMLAGCWFCIPLGAGNRVVKIHRASQQGHALSSPRFAIVTTYTCTTYTWTGNVVACDSHADWRVAIKCWNAWTGNVAGAIPTSLNGQPLRRGESLSGHLRFIGFLSCVCCPVCDSEKLHAKDYLDMQCVSISFASVTRCAWTGNAYGMAGAHGQAMHMGWQQGRTYCFQTPLYMPLYMDRQCR